MGIIKIIDRELVDERQGQGSNLMPQDSVDPLKWMIGAYYKKDGDNVSKLSAAGFHRAWAWDAIEGEEASINGIFQGKKQSIALRYTGTGLLQNYSAEELEGYLRSRMLFNTNFADHNVIIPLPSLDTNPEILSDRAIDVESFYNYEFFDYEDISSGLNSNALPSKLLFNYAEFAKDYNSEKANFIRSYNGNIPIQKKCLLIYPIITTPTCTLTTEA